MARYRKGSKATSKSTAKGPSPPKKRRIDNLHATLPTRSSPKRGEQNRRNGDSSAALSEDILTGVSAEKSTLEFDEESEDDDDGDHVNYTSNDEGGDSDESGNPKVDEQMLENEDDEASDHNATSHSRSTAMDGRDSSGSGRPEISATVSKKRKKSKKAREAARDVRVQKVLQIFKQTYFRKVNF